MQTYVYMLSGCTVLFYRLWGGNLFGRQVQTRTDLIVQQESTIKVRVQMAY